MAEQEDDETGHSSLSLDPLADDLKQLVTDDNERFQSEMKLWDEAKEKRAVASRAANAATSTSEDRAVFLAERKVGVPGKGAFRKAANTDTAVVDPVSSHTNASVKF